MTVSWLACERDDNEGEEFNLEKFAQFVDVGILTIREDEFQAVLKSFPKEVAVARLRRQYSIREADAGNGQKYHVAVVRQIEQGNGEAQAVARDLIEDFDPSLLLVVGIAGAIPSEDFTLGDVVFSSRIHDYSLESRKFNARGEFSLTGGPLAKQITSGLAMLSGRTEMQVWQRDMKARPSVSPKASTYYGPAKWQDRVRESIEHHFGRKAAKRKPIFITGPLASSDRLVKDPTVLVPLLQSARHVMAVEMESGGVYRAAQERCPMLAIRGISDVIGLKRSDEWTKFACTSAAVATKAYLTTQPVDPKTKAQKAVEAKNTLAEESIFINLVEISSLPEILYVAPASVPTVKVAWAKMLKRKRTVKPPKPIPNAWTIQSGNVYSFFDPIGTPLEKVIDDSALEEHSTKEFFAGNDPDKRHLLVQLMRRALEDDLRQLGVRFFADDRVFGFMGRPGEADRTFKYQNVHNRSEITVVSHKPLEQKKPKKKDGPAKKYPKRKKGEPKPELIRHLCFAARFLQVGPAWYIEITPTYRFTFDGNRKGSFHEAGLKGIKGLERNRAVLSQVLLWTDLLCTLPQLVKSHTHLTFKRIPPFVISALESYNGPTDGRKIKSPRPARMREEVEL